MVTEVKRSKYRLLGLIGQGQFGRVFCATHRTTGRLVALKNLDHQRFPTHKFLRELRFLLSLQHSNIVNCQALEHSRDGRYLVMDYCEGGTLRSLMESESGFTLGHSLKLIVDILAGLEHAHSREIVHCDIKPENILLSVQPTGWAARISDFGIARLSQELADESGNTGSPAYMAPERFYGQYSHSSDLYAVGVMLFELLVGDRPFCGTPSELMSVHLNQPVTIPAAVPPSLRPIILASLQKLPARRYHSAAEMRTAVQTALDSEELAPQLNTKLPNPYAASAGLTPPTCSATHFQGQALLAPIIYLAAGQSGPLYQATLTGTGCQLLTGEVQAKGGQTRFVATAISQEIPDLVQEVIGRPQGCFAIARRAIYWWDYLSPDPSRRVSMSAPKLLAHFDTDFITTLDPGGKWMATGALDPHKAANDLTIWRFPTDYSLASLEPMQAPTVCQSSPPFQLFALDSRHVVVLSTMASPDLGRFSGPVKSPTFVESERKGCTQGTLVEILTRRGSRIGSWNLPVPIQQATLSTRAYRLLATEYFSPTSVLLIDLKPLRVMRIEVGIRPIFLTATDWGYILVDQQGKVVILDDEGRQVGCIDGFQDAGMPSEAASRNNRVTAVTLYHQHILLLSTWNGVQHRGNFYAVDLRTLEIDLVF